MKKTSNASLSPIDLFPNDPVYVIDVQFRCPYGTLEAGDVLGGQACTYRGVQPYAHIGAFTHIVGVSS